MKISILSGSHRLSSQSFKVAKFMENLIENELEGVVKLFDLATIDMPFAHFPDSPQLLDFWKKEWLAISKHLETSDGFIFVTPEWNGMATPMIKNFFLFVQNEMVHKPALIVSVSSAFGGAFPVSELRSSCYKNTFVNFIPEHLIIRKVGNVMNSNGFNLTDCENEDDFYIRSRTKYTVQLLLDYCQSARLLIEKRGPDNLRFSISGNGMS